MLVDIVIDTNVMLHADNDGEPRQPAARDFLSDLLRCGTELCVDQGFDVIEARNRSLIGAEYLAKLVPGSLGFAVVARLAEEGRVKELAPTRAAATKRKINQVIRTKRDRTFLAVAIASNEEVFVSHDFRDFSKNKRRDLKRMFGIQIIEAAECRLLEN